VCLFYFLKKIIKFLIRVNLSFQSALGFEASELIGKHFSALTHPDDKEENIKKIKEMVESGATELTSQKRYMHKNGDIIYAIAKISLLKYTGKEPVFMVQIVNINQIKQTEELLKQKNIELEKTNAELDKFVYSAAHDLRAPLTSIMGLINVAKIDQPEKQGYYFDLIETSITKLDDFIKEVIDYSKNARLGVSNEKINFNNLLRKIFENHSYIKGANDIENEIEIKNSISFVSDNRRIEIILNNLISNAIKYHDPSKKGKFIKVSISIDENKAIVEITDNGQGINSQNLEKIFNIFYRGNQDSTGSGLGLFIVKETIEKLNGAIDVSSEIGKGTTFLLRIPNLYKKVPVEA